ncbi:MAG: hypothetical protein KBA86_02920 [Bacteroidales bacterium]|nr:hypothetical protein [Bacteroidales bacterium]
MKSAKYTLIQTGLIIGIIVLALLIYRSLMRPVKFNEIYEARKTTVIKKLEDIRTLQNFYKNEKGAYAKSFDELKSFYTDGKMRIIVKEGHVPDTLTEIEAIKLKIVRRDTVLVNAKDEILKSLPNLDVKTFDIIPYSHGEQFIIDADTIVKGNINVHVYEVKALKSQYLKNLNDDSHIKTSFLSRILFNDLQDQFLGPKFDYKDNVIDLILGSLTEATTDGNWQ